MPEWLIAKSRMNREVHVRFCERLGVKFPRPTRLSAAGIRASCSFVGASPPHPLMYFLFTYGLFLDFIVSSESKEPVDDNRQLALCFSGYRRRIAYRLLSFKSLPSR